MLSTHRFFFNCLYNCIMQDTAPILKTRPNTDRDFNFNIIKQEYPETEFIPGVANLADHQIHNCLLLNYLTFSLTSNTKHY